MSGAVVDDQNLESIALHPERLARQWLVISRLFQLSNNQYFQWADPYVNSPNKDRSQQTNVLIAHL
jgi:hypothetical protein